MRNFKNFNFLVLVASVAAAIALIGRIYPDAPIWFIYLIAACILITQLIEGMHWGVLVMIALSALVGHTTGHWDYIWLVLVQNPGTIMGAVVAVIGVPMIYFMTRN